MSVTFEDLQRHKGFNFAYMEGPDGPFSTIVYVDCHRFWVNVEAPHLLEFTSVYSQDDWNGELHKYKIMALKPVDMPSWRLIKSYNEKQKEQQQ